MNPSSVVNRKYRSELIKAPCEKKMKMNTHTNYKLNKVINYH